MVIRRASFGLLLQILDGGLWGGGTLRNDLDLRLIDKGVHLLARKEKSTGNGILAGR